MMRIISLRALNDIFNNKILKSSSPTIAVQKLMYLCKHYPYTFENINIKLIMYNQGICTLEEAYYYVKLATENSCTTDNDILNKYLVSSKDIKSDFRNIKKDTQGILKHLKVIKNVNDDTKVKYSQPMVKALANKKPCHLVYKYQHMNHHINPFTSPNLSDLPTEITLSNLQIEEVSMDDVKNIIKQIKHDILKYSNNTTNYLENVKNYIYSNQKQITPNYLAKIHQDTHRIFRKAQNQEIKYEKQQFDKYNPTKCDWYDNYIDMRWDIAANTSKGIYCNWIEEPSNKNNNRYICTYRPREKSKALRKYLKNHGVSNFMDEYHSPEPLNYQILMCEITYMVIMMKEFQHIHDNLQYSPYYFKKFGTHP